MVLRATSCRRVVQHAGAVIQHVPFLCASPIKKNTATILLTPFVTGTAARRRVAGRVTAVHTTHEN